LIPSWYRASRNIREVAYNRELFQIFLGLPRPRPSQEENVHVVELATVVLFLQSRIVVDLP